jgi:hydroxyacylglutathione hydrolase
VPLSRLQDSFGALPVGPLVVHCASDYRASIAASLLRREGFEDVTVLVGGIAAWEAASPEPEDAVAT